MLFGEKLNPSWRLEDNSQTRCSHRPPGVLALKSHQEGNCETPGSYKLQVSAGFIQKGRGRPEDFAFSQAAHVARLPVRVDLAE